MSEIDNRGEAGFRAEPVAAVADGMMAIGKDKKRLGEQRQDYGVHRPMR